MNRTNFEHAGFALLMQLVIWLLAGDVWLGAAFAAAFFTGREHAQREYHIGDPSTLPPWAGFDIWRWSIDSKLDLLFPILTVLVVSAVFEFFNLQFRSPLFDLFRVA